MVNKKIIQTRTFTFKQAFPQKAFLIVHLVILVLPRFFLWSILLGCWRRLILYGVGEEVPFLCIKEKQDFPKIVYIVARGSFWKKWIRNFCFLLIKKYVESCLFFSCFGHITRNGVGCECGIKVSHAQKKCRSSGSSGFHFVFELWAKFHVDRWWSSFFII